MSEYSNSGLIQTATFEGIVHGVVVHITNDIPFKSLELNNSFTFSKDESSTLNETSKFEIS